MADDSEMEIKKRSLSSIVSKANLIMIYLIIQKFSLNNSNQVADSVQFFWLTAIFLEV